MRLSKFLGEFFEFGFSLVKLKLSGKRKFWYEELKMFNASLISFMKDSSFCERGL